MSRDNLKLLYVIGVLLLMAGVPLLLFAYLQNRSMPTAYHEYENSIHASAEIMRWLGLIPTIVGVVVVCLSRFLLWWKYE